MPSNPDRTRRTLDPHAGGGRDGRCEAGGLRHIVEGMVDSGWRIRFLLRRRARVRVHRPGCTCRFDTHVGLGTHVVTITERDHYRQSDLIARDTATGTHDGSVTDPETNPETNAL